MIDTSGKGKLIASVRDEIRQWRRGTLQRDVHHYALFEQDDHRFLLCHELRTPSTGGCNLTEKVLDSLHEITRIVPDRIGDKMIDQFLSAI